MPQHDPLPTTHPDFKNTRGRPLATLELHRDDDGHFWLTCADARVAIRMADKMMSELPPSERMDAMTPMELVASWVYHGATNFIRAWGKYDKSKDNRGSMWSR